MIKIGFIGLGAMARNHLERLGEIPNATVVAGADPDAQRREERAAKFGFRGYADYQEMLEQTDLDAVYVCLPPYAHTGQEQAVIERNLAIFVEKPVCLDLTYARQTAEAISASGIINSVGYMCRYLDVVAEAKQIIGSSPIVAMRGFYFSPIPRSPWWTRKALSGGQIVEQATHVVDLMRYFAGEAVKVSAEGYRGVITDVDGYDLEDAATVNLPFCERRDCQLDDLLRPEQSVCARAGDHHTRSSPLAGFAATPGQAQSTG